MDKLSSVSAGVISMMDAKTVCHLATEWAKAYNQKLYTALTQDTAYSTALFAIDRGGKKPRKDIVKWSDIEDYVSYFYDSLYARQREDTGIPAADQKAVLKAYLGVFDAGDDKDTWFNKIKELCAPLGFCADTKEYKASPESYKGSVSDVSTVIRVAVTGRKNTPDLHAIMALLGQETVKNRICEYIEEM
ncbi:MAG: glutamate--tRNA ligase, partial [Angelakisella sp.]